MQTVSSTSRCFKRLSSLCYLPYTQSVSVPSLGRSAAAAFPACRYNSTDSEKTGSPISWKTVAVTGTVGVGVGYALYSAKKEKEQIREEAFRKSVGKAAIGGDWELIDCEGKTRTNKDYFGQWVLIYFGFTHCPDICPDEMEKMVEAVDAINADKSVPNVIPMFITVDPERDTPKMVGEYVKEFSPSMIGLTGTKEQVDDATRAFRIYYSSGPKDEDNDYIVDHSIIMYLVGPDGAFVDYYGQNKTANDLVSGISLHMAKYRRANH